ncbi:MAG: hypothetical protein OXB86_02170 [Bdellovibrionales bacterium]|nr:hypothetical protein [Bdellovibrionales bacterium]
MYFISKMRLKNRWLRTQDSRPDIYNEKNYTAWLMEQQKNGEIPDKPYGYGLSETLEPPRGNSDGYYYARHEIITRRVPAWIDNAGLLKGSSEATQAYKDWAEAYYLESNFYPPGYLQYVRNSLYSHFFSGLFIGFKEDRHLRDVVYSMGGRPPADNGDKKGSSTLINLIRGLTGQDRWLDGGTGSGFVLQDALEGMRKERGIKDIPNVLGITYNTINPEDFDPAVVPENFLSSSSSYPVRLPESLLEKYEVWDRRLFQDIPIHELMPKFKLVTDFFGIYTYSSDPVEVINKYLNVMKVEGALGIVYNNKDFVRTEKGVVPLHEWLESVSGQGLSVEHGIGWLNSPGAEKESGEIAYMLIRRNSNGRMKLPNLTMVEYGDAQRIFRPSADISNAF